MNLNFSHMIFVRCDDSAAIVELLEQWDVQQASADIMGYMGARLVSAADEATRNDERPETQAWATRLRAIVEGEPGHHNYDEIYRTDFGAFAKH